MYEDCDLRGLYKHFKKSVGLGGRQSGGQQFIKDENGVLLRDKAEALQRWARFFSTLLNTKSTKLNPAIIEEVQQRPAAPTTVDSVPLGSAPTLEETRRAIRGMHNWKAPGPDSLVAELLKTDEPAEPIVLERFCSLAFRPDQLLLWGLPLLVPSQAQSLHYQHGRPTRKPSQERK